MRLFSIITEHFKMDGGACFGVVPKSIWQKYICADENNLITLCNRCLLIEDGNKLILIDTGIGNKHDEKFLSFLHISNQQHIQHQLNRLGYNNTDVTDVILTHLHFDHCGGCVYKTDDGNLQVTFPNAVHHISAEQWDWALKSNPREKASYFLQNYQLIHDNNLLQLHKNNGSINENISFRLFYGHTIGQLIPFIKYKDKIIVFTADFIPSVAHLPLIYIPSFDLQPLKTIEEKKAFMAEAIINNYILFFEHDLATECCTAMYDEKNYKAKELFTLNEIS